MTSSIEQLKRAFEEEIQHAKNSDDLEKIRVKYLGKKGPVQGLMKELKEIAPDERPLFGQKVNELKAHMEEVLASVGQKLLLSEQVLQLENERIDTTIPGRRHYLGGKHLLTAAMDEILDVLIGMGFSVQCGPDIETDFYNFEALNFAPDHPARDMQDTFWLDKEWLLRTHTTNIQVRMMEAHKPPIRIISPGKVYRNEAVTQRSHVFFRSSSMRAAATRSPVKTARLATAAAS